MTAVAPDSTWCGERAHPSAHRSRSPREVGQVTRRPSGRPGLQSTRRRHGAVVRVCESDLGSISADQYNAAQAYIATVTATH